MPDPTLQELFEELQQQAEPSQKHQVLIQALQNYETQTAQDNEREAAAAQQKREAERGVGEAVKQPGGANLSV